MPGLGIGLVGTGYMGKCHALAWNAVAPVFGDVERPRLVALAEVDEDLAKQKAAELGFKRSTGDWHTLLDDDKIDVPGHQRAKRGRKPLDPALPREVVRHELPEGERVCPHDGAALREIGVEATEQLDIIPQQVRVIRHERVKYACSCCDAGLRLASKPEQVIPKG